MYLIDPVELQNAIGAQGSQGAGSLQVDLVLAVLDNLRPLIEGSMNIASLDYLACTNTFLIDRSSDSDRARRAEFEYYNRYQRPLPRRQVLRLTNALLDKSVPVVITFENNSIVDPATYEVDAELGMVSMTAYVPGAYTVTYTSGLKLPNLVDAGHLAVYQNVPRWIKSAILSHFILWSRAYLLQVRLPGTVAFSDAANEIHRGIHSRIYSNFMRPRSDCLWANSYSAP